MDLSVPNKDPIDTTSPGGLLVFQIFCALAEHERNVIIQRTRAGLDSARARGRKGDRPKGLALKYQRMAPSVKNLYELGQQSTTEIINSFQIGSRRTLYKVLRHAGVILSQRFIQITRMIRFFDVTYSRMRQQSAFMRDR